MAKSYRNHFKLKEGEFFVKKLFDYAAYCNSRYTSANENILARLQNALASGLNFKKDTRLPTYIVVILDDDLIFFMNFQGEGLATLLGSWVEWLTKEFNQLISLRKKQLPDRCNKEVFLYWMTAPAHTSFSRARNNLRIKFNLSLDSVIRTQHQNMRIIKAKDHWDLKNPDLVAHDRITEAGMAAYWHAIDASINYNVERREIFLAKKLSLKHEHPADHNSNRFDRPTHADRDPMRDFFRRTADRMKVPHREVREDPKRNLETCRRFREEKKTQPGRFMLPHLQNRF